MAARVTLRDVIDAMDLPNEDWQSYLNRDTDEIVTVSDEDRAIVEDHVDLDDLPDWQREALPRTREALESNRFLYLPGSFEVFVYRVSACERPRSNILSLYYVFASSIRGSRDARCSSRA